MNSTRAPHRTSPIANSLIADHYHSERPHQGLGNELIDSYQPIEERNVTVHEDEWARVEIELERK